MQRVLILYGGRSAEHEISILSARFIASSLDPARFEALLVAIAPDGRWRLQRDEQLPRAGDARSVAVGDGPRAHILPMPDGGMLHVEGGAPVHFDVAFPVLHGPMGEDGSMQGLFELASVPYVGAGVTGSAVGMDKLLQKQLYERLGLPVLPYTFFGKLQWERDRAAAVSSCEALGFPLFVKPANMGSSLGVRKVAAAAELDGAVAHALELDTKIVVERGLSAPREIECSVLGNHEPRASLPGEIVVRHPDGFYSYDAKYLDDGAALTVPAPLPPAEITRVQELAVRAFRALDLAGMARVDLFLSAEGELYLNEVNTIPGFTSISMYPRMWAASGVPARELVTELIELGLARHAERAALRTVR
jgi:D-alanine-D-alanine ligase